MHGISTEVWYEANNTHSDHNGYETAISIDRVCCPVLQFPTELHMHTPSIGHLPFSSLLKSLQQSHALRK